MKTLNFEWLDGLGLGGLSSEEKRSLMLSVIGELQSRVGERLAEGLADEQLEQFHALMEAGDEQGAKQWLEESAPDYKQTVQAVLEEIEEELRSRSKDVLEARRS